ncbi:MAG TPA: gliding motility-associated C-terminal domain-containing protein [Bacteroidia bacterium]|jgi:gliding motility-associated-like protein
MRKLLTLVSLIFISNLALAQDISVIAITAPVSGCSLSATSSVTVNVKNVGLTDLSGTPFDLSYTINGGAPITDVGVTIPFFAPNTTVSYTFTTTTDLSVAGTYTFTAFSTYAPDINTTNDATTGYVVTSVAPSVGGTVAGGTNVCTGSNSGVLTLSGHTGAVQNWEYSTDGGSTWISISNTTTTQSYFNLTVPTRYRAQVQNGACTAATSSIAIMTIDPTTVGGSVTPAAVAACSGANSGTLTLSGRVGAVVRWEFSIDAGVTWTPIANTAATQSYLNLTQTTRYRAVVQSGACLAVNSSVSIITVSSASVGGTVSGGTTVCSGANSGNLTLAGHTGSVTRWEFSTNAGVTWTNIANTTTTNAYLNIAATRYYRALVTNGGCGGVYSTVDSIVVNPASVGGTIASAATVCSGANGGTLTLSGNTGTVQYWEFSTNGGVTYTNIPNVTTTQTYLNLTQTTIYRANVKSGACAAVNSSTVTITVSPVSVGGTTAINDTVCSGANSGTITLSGHTGTVTNWQSSLDGITWTNIANTTTSQSYLNLIATNYYQANVTSGACPSALSTIDTITVNTPSVGGVVDTTKNICFGNNSGTLLLTGATGAVVRWESSIDGGINWTAIANTTSSYIYLNLTLTTQFRAVVQNGACNLAYSTPAILTVDPTSVGGTISGSATACGGSNSGTLNLISYVGTIQGWESSTDGGLTWTSIANTTATENYVNVLTTTMYHVIVNSGVCSSDTSATATITVDPPSVGGTLTAGDTVCASSNLGTLTVSGFTGTIQHWESSTDGGITWLTLANTSATQTYMNLAVTTSYRVFVKSGVCNGTTSNIITITVDPVAVGGTLNGSATVCDTINSGTLSLTGSVGTVLNWESSTDAGLTWSTIVNATTSQNYTNLTDTTWFRAIVTSGLCGNDTSSTATITVNPATVAGMVSMSDTVCTGMNSDTLYLTGYTGAILGWESSSDGGFNWASVSNTTDSLIYNNLTTSMMYRAIVKSGICNAATSLSATISVDPMAVGGTVSGGTTICDTINSGTLTLTGSVGSVQNWESSTDGGLTWAAIINSTTTLNYTNLTDTTWFRAIVMSGICGSDTSTSATVYVNPATVAGMISVSDTVCSGTNNGTLYLMGYTGSILGWETSVDGGFNWIPLSNTSDSLVYNNLTVTTMYRAIVKSGICNSMTATAATITVNPVSDAGTISGAVAGCEGTNGGTLTVAGYAGTIQDWESSIDAGTTWTSLVNTTSSQTYLNLTDTTWYRVIVQSGVCSADTSASVAVIVYPKPVAMFSADTVCYGNVTTFTNASTISSGFIQFNQWDFGDGSNSLSVSPTHMYGAAGTYTANLLLTSNQGCLDTATVSVLVNALPPSTITASGPLQFCSGDSLILSAATGGFDYLWSTADTTQSITVMSAGTYVLTISDTLTGCMAMDSVDVTVLPSPTVSAGNDVTLSLGSSVVLNGTGAGVVTWSWFPNTGLDNPTLPDPTASPVATTIYTLTGIDVNGCSDSDTMTVTVIMDYNVIISNVMTPNDDGYNDRWIIQNIENYPNTQVMVVNREGQQVFSSESYDNNWDGQGLPDGTYYYIIKFENDVKIFKGAITILKQSTK